jgi:hypothetical protein
MVSVENGIDVSIVSRLALDSAGRADHREEVLDNDWLPAHGLAEFRRCNLFEDSAKLLAADDRPEPGCCAYCPPAPPRLRDACAKFAPDSSLEQSGFEPSVPLQSDGT